MSLPTNGNEKDIVKRVDPVVDAYRQASTHEAAGPKASVRTAVLAHARVVAAANADGAQRVAYTPANVAAANDHSWMWRAAAGLVLGVLGVLMFQWMQPSGGNTETTVASAPLAAPSAATGAAPPGATTTAPAQASEPPATPAAAAATPNPAVTNAEPNAAEKVALAQAMEAADRARANAKSATVESKSVQQERVAAAAAKAARTADAAPALPASASVANRAPVVASPAPAAAEPMVAAASPPPAAAPASPAAPAPVPSSAAGVAVAAAAAAPRYEVAARGDIAMAMPKRAPAGSADSARVAGNTNDAGPAQVMKSASKPQFENSEARRPSASAVASVGATVAADTPRARDVFGAAPAAKTPLAPSARGALSAIDADMFRAIRRNDLDAVRAAISRGANVNAKDEGGRSALEIARDDNRDELAEILVAAGAK
jgi:hypothetical protein